MKTSPLILLFVCLLAGSVARAAGGGVLERGPYLQMPGSTAITLRWRSSESVIGRVCYGESPGTLTASVDESTARQDHEVRLTGLTPNTAYFYSIGAGTDTLLGDATTTFRTPPPAGAAQPVRIWVLGDAGTGSPEQGWVRDAFSAWTGSTPPSFVLQLGDNAYNSGTDAEFQANFFDIYPDFLRRVPFWPCLGNHETDQQTDFVDTYPYFGIYTLPAAGECGGVASGTEHYYSFDHGNVHVISLDSMTADRSPSGAMATWLTADLAATTATWIIVIFHHPPYSRGSHDSDSETELVEMRENIGPILENGGVDLVLTGHSHSYERSYLLDGHYGASFNFIATMKLNGGDGRMAGDGAYIKPRTGPREHFGTVYAVAGSSGQVSDGPLDHPAHFIGLAELGSLVLDVNGMQLDARFINATGSVDDSFTLLKRGAADTDGDGVSDVFEMAHGMDRYNPADATLDSDGDGNDALDEYLLKLDPGIPDSYSWSISANPANDRITVTFDTQADRLYRVYRSVDLLAWQPVSASIAGDGATKQWVDPAAGGPRRFYRVEVQAAP